MTQNCRIFSSMVFANPIFIFSKGNIQDTMYLAFNLPIATPGFQNCFRIRRQAENEIAGLDFIFSYWSLRNNSNNALQAFSLLALAYQQDILLCPLPSILRFQSVHVLY